MSPGCGAAESTHCLVPAHEGGPEGWALPVQAGRTRPRRAHPRTCPCIEVSQPREGQAPPARHHGTGGGSRATAGAHPCPWAGEHPWESRSPQHSHPGQQHPSLPALRGMAPHGDRDMSISSSFPWVGTVQRPLCSPGQHYLAPGTMWEQAWKHSLLVSKLFLLPPQPP